MSAYEAQPERRGWRLFAGSMFLLAAAFNAVWGIAALANDEYFAGDELLFGDLAMWGVFYLCVALTQAITGVLVFSHNWGGVVMGILIAMASALLALLSIGAYPLWSVIVLVVDGLVIYGLTVLPDD